MTRALWVLPLIASCVGGPSDEGERCNQLGAMSCSFGGDVMMCVGKRWAVQEVCDIEAACTSSRGESFCSYGGEPCDEAGATKCDDTFTLVTCDGKAWELLSDCFPGTCQTVDGDSFCEDQ